MPGTDPFVAGLGLWATVHGITALMIAMPDFDWPPVSALLSAWGAGASASRDAKPVSAGGGQARSANR